MDLLSGGPAINAENPMGTDGFEFVEFAHPDPPQLAALFETMGFVPVARHRSKDVTLYRQGDVNYVLNAEPSSFAADFQKAHGPSVCCIGFRVVDAAFAVRRAASLGVRSVDFGVGPMEFNIPAIEGVGGSLIYLVDQIWRTRIDLGRRFPLDGANAIRKPVGAGLTMIDHLTHNVYRGHMDALAQWYERILQLPRNSLFQH